MFGPAYAAALGVMAQIPGLGISPIQERAAELLADTTLDGEHRRTEYAPMLAGIAANPRSRALLDLAIDRACSDRSEALGAIRYQKVPEILIGSGPHAAIYNGAKVQGGSRIPLILEQADRIGGTFAIGRRPIFTLNSRNRRETRFLPRRPGTKGPLNSEVGGLIQPSDFSYQEYQSQLDQATVTRINLAVTIPDVVLGAQVESITPLDYGEIRVDFRRAGEAFFYETNRVVLATGLGVPKITVNIEASDEGVMTFPQFLRQMGDPANTYPLRGFKRVAVIGASDSGNVTVEYLLGQAGDHGLSVAGLDFVDEICWIGQDAKTKVDFERKSRSRYSGIGRYMPREDDPDYYYLVTQTPGRALTIKGEPGNYNIDIRTSQGPIVNYGDFDHVFLCTGFEDATNQLIRTEKPLVEESFVVGDRAVAKKIRGYEIYKIGPAANLPVTPVEREKIPALQKVPANTVALFRYSELTASLGRYFAEFDRGQSYTGIIYSERKYRDRPLAAEGGEIFFGKRTELPHGIMTEDVIRMVALEYFDDISAGDGRLICDLSLKADAGGFPWGFSYEVSGFTKKGLRRRRELPEGEKRRICLLLEDEAMQAALSSYFALAQDWRLTLPFEGRLDTQEITMGRT